MLAIQYSKTVVVGIIAIFFTLLVFNNTTDYETNHWCVEYVFGMKDVRAPNVLWRAIQNPWIITLGYVFIIAVEATIASLLWIATFRFLKKRDGRSFGIAGLTLGFGLFMLGFVVIANEWFYMWQTPILAGLQQKAAIYSLLMLVCLMFVSSKD